MDLANLIRMAEENEHLMDGTTGPVADIIASTDVVFAVYSDSASPSGVGRLIIKGAPFLAEIAAGNGAVEAKVTAIRTADLEMAMAARLVLGDGRPENSHPN